MEVRLHALSTAGLAAAACAAGFTAWLGAAVHPSTGIALLGGVAVLLPGFSRAVNIFGQDGGAIRRYALAGVPWRSVFEARNAAWLTVSSLGCVPLAVALAVRVGTAAALSFGLSAILFMALAVAWGNLSSIIFAAARHGRDGGAGGATGDAAGAGPPFVNQAAPFIFCGLILILHVNVGPFGSAPFDLAAAACTVGAVASRAVFLRRVSRSFDQELEMLLERMRR
jgi:hypothetical protein